MQDAQLTPPLGDYRMFAGIPGTVFRPRRLLMTTPQLKLHARLLPLLKQRRAPAVAAFLTLLVAALAACGGGQEAGRAPDFLVTRFDGAEFRLSDQVGRGPVVLNFWYPTCPPCRAEMPAFERAWQQLRDEGVLFLGLFVPQGFDTEQDARDFVGELRLTYAFATDNGTRIAREYEIEYFPTTFFIDESGRIFKKQISTLDEDEIVRIVREMTQG